MDARAENGSEPPRAGRRGARRRRRLHRADHRSRSPTPRRARRERGGARGATHARASPPTCSRRVMALDFDALAAALRAVAELLTDAAEAHVTCPPGTRPAARTSTGREGIADDGELTEPRRVRQPALRRGLHRTGRAGEGTLVVEPRSPRRPGPRARDADRRGRPPRRRRRRAGGARCSSCSRAHGDDGTQPRRARRRHQRPGDAHRQRARGREDPRHRPRRVRRQRRRSAAPSRCPSTSTSSCSSRRSTSAARGCSTPAATSSERACCSPSPTSPRGATPAAIDAIGAAFAAPAAPRCSTSTPTPTTTAPSSRSPASRAQLGDALARGRARGGRARSTCAATRACTRTSARSTSRPLVHLDADDARRGVRRGAGDRRADRRELGVPGLPLRRARRRADAARELRRGGPPSSRRGSRPASWRPTSARASRTRPPARRWSPRAPAARRLQRRARAPATSRPRARSRRDPRGRAAACPACARSASARERAARRRSRLQRRGPRARRRSAAVVAGDRAATRRVARGRARRPGARGRRSRASPTTCRSAASTAGTDRGRLASDSRLSPWPRPSASAATKHRGNAAGTIETRGPHRPQADRRGAQAGRASAAPAARERARASRRPGAARPTARRHRGGHLRRRSARRSSSSRSAAALALGAFMLAPLHPDGLLHRPASSTAAAQAQAGAGRRAADGRPHVHRRPGRRELLPLPPATAPTAALIVDPGEERRADPRARSRSSASTLEAILLTHTPLRPHRRRRAGREGHRRAGLLPEDRGAGAADIMAFVPGRASAPSSATTPTRPSRAASSCELAGFEIDVLFTPGHSPGHVTYSSAARTRCSPATSSSRARSAASTCPAATGRRCSRSIAVAARPLSRRDDRLSRATWASPRSAASGRPTRSSRAGVS